MKKQQKTRLGSNVCHMGIHFVIPARPHRFTDEILDPIHRHMEEVRITNELEKHTLYELNKFSNNTSRHI